jgi:hypothetical protein
MNYDADGLTIHVFIKAQAKRDTKKSKKRGYISDFLNDIQRATRRTNKKHGMITKKLTVEAEPF